MARLFTYTIKIDDGVAPNPFHNICTLAICKPAIRRSAACADWVVGLGSKNVLSDDLSNRVVYAMKIEEIVSLEEYDRMAATRWPHKIPNISSPSTIDRLG
jgi:hypothetical protein